MARISFMLWAVLISSIVEAESFFIKDKTYEFINFQGVLIAECPHNCMAKIVMFKNKTIKLSQFKNESYISNSLGSEVCKTIFKGHSVLGQAVNRDRRAFCVFKDQSMIEINSLTDYLKQKNILK